MAQGPLWGTDASAPAGTFVPAIHANAFTLNVAQGITSYFGFGDYWIKNHGTISSWSGSISGFTTSGAASNSVISVLDSSASAGSNSVRSGESWTFTFKTGCTIVGTIIFTGDDLGVSFLGTHTSSLGFVGTGSPTETWATS